MDIERTTLFLIIGDMMFESGAVQIWSFTKVPFTCHNDGQTCFAVCAKIMENPYISLLLCTPVHACSILFALGNEFLEDIKINRRLFNDVAFLCKANLGLDNNA